MKQIWTRFLALGILAAFAAALLLPSGSWAQDKPDKLNINTASVAELQELPRVGESIARRIVDYRTKNGKFERIEDLMKVRGIGEKVFLQLKDLITVGEPVC